MSFITYPQSNGRVAVVVPVDESLTVEQVALKDVPAGLPYKIVASLDIDSDYFNAYEFDQSLGAVVNIDKAKAIHLNKFREARIPLLANLDVAYMKALEVEDHSAAAAIAIKKQELRNVTKITLPDNLADLTATWPAILNP